MAALPPKTRDRPLNNVHDVSLLLGQSTNQVRRGELAPRVATAVGYCGGNIVKAPPRTSISCLRLARIHVHTC